jgi:ADP-dependent phosphofructokinase/glucokinase
MARLNSNGTFVEKEVVASELKRIVERDGVLTPKNVVDEARDTNSPIHDLFDWNDETAGEKYRIWQARQLIVTVKVEFNDKQVDAYYNIRAEVVPQQGYYSLDQVISDEAIYQDVLAQAIKELKYWHDKYKEIKELSGLVDEAMLKDFKVKSV